MKRLLFSAALLVAAGSAAHAQAPRIGVKAGLNFANFSGKDAGQAKALAGFNGGLFANFATVGDNFFSIQPELLYSVEGAKFKPGDSKVKAHLRNLQLPVLAKIDVGGLFFEAGPQVGYLLSSKVERKDAPFAIPGGDFNRVQFGYVAGLGYQLDNGPSLEVRYNGGLRNVTEDAKLRHSVIQLQAGYLLGGRR
mgnify:CR=1 FL=1